MAKKMKKQMSAQAAQRTLPPLLYVLLGGVVFFVLVCLGSPASIKVAGIALMVCALPLGAICFRYLRERIYLPFIVLLAWVVCNGLSGFYATSGKFFVYEIMKILLAFSLAVLLMLYDRGESENIGRRAAGVMAVAIGIASLVSIDMFSTHLIADPVIKLLDALTYGTYGQVEPVGPDRMNSLFTNSNIYAGVSGIGVFLSLGLASTEPTEKKGSRFVYLAALYINSLAFVLLFSRGAIVFIAVAFLVHLILEAKERRAALLVLMVEALILVAVSAAIIATDSFGKPVDGVHPMPLLLTLGGAAALCLCEYLLHERTLRIPPKVAVAVMCVVLALVIVFAGVALLWTGSIDMDAGSYLTRTVYPEPGDYTLTVDTTVPVTVTIQGQNRQEIMLSRYNTLYSGDVNGALFTVPEDCEVVYFHFYAGENDATIHTATYTGASEGSIPLEYKLLPDFISTRMQGVLAHHSTIQRFVYFEDGMKLFKDSPIIGLGLGSFENGLKSVQSYLYETKFVHNHYVQSLLDTGIIGLVLFLGTMGTSLWALFRVLRRNPLAPALIACIVFMAGQAFMDLVFSAYAYLPFAYGVFLLANLMGGDQLPVFDKKVRLGVMGATAALLVVFSALVGSNVSAQNLMNREMSFEASIKAVKQDPFEWADYALSFIMSSLEYPEEEELRVQADAFAQRVDGIRSNSAHLKLMEYYLRTGRPEQAMAAAEKHVTHVASDPEAWQNVMNLLQTYDDGSDAYRAGVAHIAGLLADWNERNLGTITLDEAATAYMQAAVA